MTKKDKKIVSDQPSKITKLLPANNAPLYNYNPKGGSYVGDTCLVIAGGGVMVTCAYSGYYDSI